MSIMSDGLTPSKGGKWELMHYVHWVSSYLLPLGGVGASDMIDIVLGLVHIFHDKKTFHLDNDVAILLYYTKYQMLDFLCKFKNTRSFIKVRLTLEFFHKSDFH